MGLSQLFAPALAGFLVTRGRAETEGEGLEIVLLVDLITCVLAVSAVFFISIPHAVSGTLLQFISMLIF